MSRQTSSGAVALHLAGSGGKETFTEGLQDVFFVLVGYVNGHHVDNGGVDEFFFFLFFYFSATFRESTTADEQIILLCSFTTDIRQTPK